VNTPVKLIPILLYLMVGIIAMGMAFKNIAAKKFLPFQEQASGKSWNELDQGIQSVVLVLMKITGLGFLVMAFLLMIVPIVNYVGNDRFNLYAIPAISLVYCLGLYLFNFQLYRRTGAKTPWKRSLAAAVVIAAGLFLSFLV